MINTRNHPVNELELMAYLDGELSREKATAVAVHLDDCRECKALAGNIRGISQELTAWQVEPSEAEITPVLFSGLDEHIRSRENSAHKDLRVSWRGWPGRRILIRGLAASGLVILLIALSVPNLLRSPELARKAALRELQVTPTPPKAAKDSAGDEGLPLTEIPNNRSLNDVAKIAPGVVAPIRSERQTGGGAGMIGTLPIPSGPMVVRTAELFLTSTEFDQARSHVEDILKKHRGYLGDLNVSETPSSARTLTATLRVPSDQLDLAIAELKKLGRVESESQKGEEVSQQYVDLQARLVNARNSEQRLTELLRRAGKLSDVLAVEEQIESVREEIERMEAERKNLAKQVAFSTVNMKITEEYKESVHAVPEATLTRLRNAAVEGYETMVAGLINLLLFLVGWGPSLLLWGIILYFPIRWLWRRARRDLV